MLTVTCRHESGRYSSCLVIASVWLRCACADQYPVQYEHAWIFWQRSARHRSRTRMVCSEPPLDLGWQVIAPAAESEVPLTRRRRLTMQTFQEKARTVWRVRQTQSCVHHTDGASGTSAAHEISANEPNWSDHSCEENREHSAA